MTIAKCFIVIIIIIAVVMAIVQFSFLTVSYQKMEVINDLHLKVPDFVQVPAISVCAAYPTLINYSRLAKKFPEFAKELEDDPQIQLNETIYPEFVRGNGLNILKRKMGNQFTVQDLMSVSYTEDEFVQIMFIPSPETYEIISDRTEIEKRCRRTMFLKDGKTCITFNCFSENENHFNFDSVVEGKAKGSLLALRYNQSLFEKMVSISVIVHSPNTLPRGLRLQAMNVASTPEALVNAFSYRKYEYHQLPAPYASNCKNYSDDGYESQIHSIEDCENRRAKKKYGFAFPRNIRFQNDSYLIEPVNQWFQNESIKIRDMCQKKYSQPDCILQDYIPVQYPSLKFDVDYNTLLLKISREPDVVKVSVPKSSLIYYISAVCATFAFWFAVAFLGILLVTRCCKRENRQRPQYAGQRFDDNNNFNNINYKRSPPKVSFESDQFETKSQF